MPYFVLLILIVATFLFVLVLSNKAEEKREYNEIKEYGNMGERKAAFMLEHSLPGEYTVLRNVVVSYDGKFSELDTVVVGRTGVFIVEVKNMKGTIIGDCSEKYWLQRKTDQYGNTFEEEFYSPVKQVGTHVYRLANYLRDNKMFTNISSAVYFADPDFRNRITGVTNKCPVFSCYTANDLIAYIENGSENLPDKTIERIIALLS